MKKVRCKITGETFIIGREHVGDDIYLYRAMSLYGYLSEVRELDLERFIMELELTEEVELEFID